MSWDNIAMAIYFNFIPIAIMAFGCWIFIEFVKKESKRLNAKK
tara:strand:- start:11 stop:139 length:129 start_codon:yes stop_codon:yes gene_type:complete